MFNTRQNFHHSKLPKLGAIGVLVSGHDRYLGTRYLTGRRRRCIVESYPLCDNVRPYSLGIHTCVVRFLDNGARKKVNGFYFQPED